MNVKQYLDIQWVRYMAYIVGTILVLVIIYQIMKRFTGVNIVSSVPVKKESYTICTHDNDIYAANVNSITKYSKLGKKLASIHIKNVNCIKNVNSDIVVLSSNVMHWFDPNLNHIDSLETPPIDGLSWFAWHMEKWWLCSVGNETIIYCFNPEWDMIGYWKLPHKLKHCQLHGGDWGGNTLFVNDSKDMYELYLPDTKVHAALVRKIPVCFKGGSFSITGKYVWGISKDTAVKCKI